MPEDPRVTDAIYRKHAPRVFRRARQLLGNDADAHEVVQDLFLSLFESPAQFTERSSLTTFLYAATTNACLTRIRNHRNRFRLAAENLDDVSEGIAAPSPEQLTYLHRLLCDLPEPLDRVAVYYYLDDLTHEDIAKILGCSRRHVGDLLERVLEWARAQETKPC
jgi:RNA polymerase sigma factor (sigma-70 family)